MSFSKLKLRLIAPIFRNLPQFRGKSRVAKYIFNNSLDTKNLDVIARDKSEYIIPNLREPIGFYLLIDGIYEKHSLDFIRRQLPSGGVFIDIGANIGVFTITAAKFLKETGLVIAVEASPNIFSYLQKNIESNKLTNVKTLEFAVAEHDHSTVSFYEAPTDHFGMGSLAPQFHNSPIYVKTKTLDTLIHDEKIEQVDLIKVDVEGYEASVFKGAKKLLTSVNAPIILFEFCDWAEARVPGGNIGDSQRVLKEFGYKIWRINDFIKGNQPLNIILEKGSDMLIGSKYGN
ncbi:MAG: FkbM family methyltransferase [Aulosira sp. DedQUE10]|nr:FkbM family methyltransferase [Aulosira sp. DedQUE10]